MATRTGTIARIVATQKIACASSILTASMTDGSKECDDNPENEVRRHTVTPLRVLVPACGYCFDDRDHTILGSRCSALPLQSRADGLGDQTAYVRP